MSDYDVFLADCPARTTLDLVADTWSVVVAIIAAVRALFKPSKTSKDQVEKGSM